MTCPISMHELLLQANIVLLHFENLKQSSIQFYFPTIYLGGGHAMSVGEGVVSECDRW